MSVVKQLVERVEMYRCLESDDIKEQCTVHVVHTKHILLQFQTAVYQLNVSHPTVYRQLHKHVHFRETQPFYCSFKHNIFRSETDHPQLFQHKSLKNKVKKNANNLARSHKYVSHTINGVSSRHKRYGLCL